MESSGEQESGTSNNAAKKVGVETQENVETDSQDKQEDGCTTTEEIAVSTLVEDDPVTHQHHIVQTCVTERVVNLNDDSGDAHTELVYTYGVSKVMDAMGQMVPIETALGGKVVGVLFTRPDVIDPTAKDVSFTDGLKMIARQHSEEFAVLYVPGEDSEDEVKDYLSDKPDFYAISFQDKATRDSLIDQFNVYSMFHPLLIIMGPDGSRITTWGRSAVLWNPQYCVHDWKHGRHGITYSQLLLHRMF